MYLIGVFMAFLNTTPVQQFLIQKTATILSEKLETKVQIGFVDYELFNKLSLKEVYIEDQKGDSLISLENIKLGFDIEALVKKEIVCTSLSLIELKTDIVIDSNKKLNLQFILDALKQDKPTEIKFTLRLNDISIKNSQISFKNYTKEFKKDRLDPNNLAINDLNIKLSIDELNSDTLIAKLKLFNFKEKSGFELKDFSGSISAGKQNAAIKDLEISLPQSEIKFAPISIVYDSLANLKKINKIHADIELLESTVNFTDLKAFSPVLERLNGNINVSTHLKGSLSNIKVHDLTISYNDALKFNGELSLFGLPKINETFVHAKIKQLETDKPKLQKLLSNLQGRQITLPKQLNKLGKIHYSGNISGFLSNIVAYGNLRTDIGSISTDIMLEAMPDFKGFDYSGKLQTKHLEIGKLKGDSSDIGSIAFNIKSKGSIRPEGQASGTVDGTISSFEYKQYEYKDILLDGKFEKKEFIGSISLNDPNATIEFNGLLNLNESLPSAHFQLIVDNFNPHNLNLSKNYPDLNFALKAEADFSGNRLDQRNSNIRIDSVLIQNKNTELYINKIHVSSTITDTLKTIRLNSDLAQGIIKGKYTFKSLAKNFKEIIKKHIPSAYPDLKTETKRNEYNSFVFQFSKIHVNELFEVFGKDIALSDSTQISGFYNDKTNKYHLRAHVPYLKLGKRELSNTLISISDEKNALDISTKSLLNKKTKLNLDSRIYKDSVSMSFKWDKPQKFTGSLNILNIFKRNEDNNICSDIHIYPTKIWIKNVPWMLEQSLITTDYKSIQVKDFTFRHEDNYVKINGVGSKSIDDKLKISLHDFQLGNILFAANVRKPQLDALLNGECTISSLFNKMVLDIDATGKNFSYYDAVWGDVTLKSSWNNIEKKVVAKGEVIKNNAHIASIAGEYHRLNDSLNFYADADSLNLRFLRYYLNGVVENVDGLGSGRLRIFGSLKKHILLEGDIAVRNGQFDVDILKSRFHFNDIVHIRRNSISFDKVKVYDDKNTPAIFNGKLTHEHFKNMNYDFTIDCKNIHGLNTTKKDNETFYGSVYGTGKVRILGSPGKATFNINMKSNENSKFNISLETAAEATENSFIQFVDKTEKKAIAVKKKNKVDSNTKTRIILNLLIEATPDVEVSIITDPVGGDMVKATGNGNLKLEYDNYNNLKLFGGYEVEEGEYIFTLQQVVRKNFKLKRGGTIRWSGDPYVALINLDAQYPIPSVSLLDILDESQLEGVARTSVPVNCLLNLTGDLTKPNIQFDMEIPSNAEVQRQIKSIINTDEMMNRQILALLVMNRFYKPDYLQATSSGRNSEMVSLLTTTVSGQLNHWLSQLSNKVNIGINARLSNGQNFNDGGEYEVALMYQPNNRLIINSNLGYRNDMINTTSSNFIGDVDVEYKLTKSGKLRAKAYTHSADNYYYNVSGTAKTTQGVGLLYREEFDNFQELTQRYFNRDIKKNDSIKAVDKSKTKVKVK